MEKFAYVGTKTFNELPSHTQLFLLQNRLTFDSEQEMQDYVHKLNLSLYNQFY